jgi:hypothetical protein
MIQGARVGNLGLILVSMFLLLGCKACPSSQDDEQECLRFSRSALQDYLDLVEGRKPLAGGHRIDFIDKDAFVARLKAAIAFLDGRKALDAPYVVSATMTPSENTPAGRDQEGDMCICWLETKRHAEGIMLTYTDNSADTAIMLPVFADEPWGEDEIKMYAGTAIRIRWVRVHVKDNDQPVVQKTTPGGRHGSSLVLVFPAKLLSSPLRVSIYDSEGNGINEVPVFVGPRVPIDSAPEFSGR